MIQRRTFLASCGAAAAVVSVLVGFATTASATTMTAPAGTLYTSTFNLTSSGMTFHGPADWSCTSSTMEGKFESHGKGVTAKGNISKLTFASCIQHFVVKKGGSLEVHGLSGNKGTLTWSGAEITLEFTTIFGNIHCVYGTSNTHIGTITGAASPTGHATLSIDSAPIPVISGNYLCGESAEWTGSYKLNTPTGLTIDQ